MPYFWAALVVPAVLCAAERFNDQPLYLTTDELCRRQARYSCESHVVQTPDGYLLALHRILRADLPGAPGPPVFLCHGLFMGSDIWLLAQPHNSLGFLLADEGYDVWLGNLRGNAFSRNHTSLSPDQKDFWKFTWHEMGVWDVPAMLRHVRLARGDEEPVRYVGHSMGGTALLVACAENPQSCSALSGAVLLAPGVFLASARSPFVHALMRLHDRLWDMFYLSGHYECMEHNRRMSRIVRMCDYSIPVRRMCETIYDVTLGRSYFGINETVALTYFAHVPTGTSIYTVDHFTQIIKSGKFQHYDRSISGRINKKSTANVPAYDLSKVTIPIAIYYSKADTIVDAEGVLELSRSLPNVVTLRQVADPNFDHFSFIVGNNVRELLYDQILASLRAM